MPAEQTMIELLRVFHAELLHPTDQATPSAPKLRSVFRTEGTTWGRHWVSVRIKDGSPPTIDYEGAVHHVYPRAIGANALPMTTRIPHSRALHDRGRCAHRCQTACLVSDAEPRPCAGGNPKANLSEFMQHWLSRYAHTTTGDM